MNKIGFLFLVAATLAACSSKNITSDVRAPSASGSGYMEGTGDIDSSKQEVAYSKKPTTGQECVLSKRVKDVSEGLGGANILGWAKAIYIFNETQFMTDGDSVNKQFKTLIGIKRTLDKVSMSTVPTTQTTHFEKLDGSLLNPDQIDREPFYAVYTHSYNENSSTLKREFVVKHYQKVVGDHWSEAKVVATFKHQRLGQPSSSPKEMADLEYVFKCPAQ